MGQPIPIDLPPGVVKGESMIASGGRFTDSNNVRWVKRRPQKIGGFEAVTSTPFDGIARGMTAWGDNSGRRQFIGIGTALGLYAISSQDFDPVDITPFEKVETVNNPFATTNGSPTVTVSLTGHGATVGRLVNFTGASAVAGLTLDGDYTVVSVPTVDTFTITAGSNANSTTTGGGSVTIGVELSDGQDNISSGFGWGVGGYGSGTYGTPRELSSIVTYPRSWSLSSFGKLLIANPIDGGVYSWDPTETPTQRAELVPNAPTRVAFAFVTSERTVFLLGTNSNGDQDKMQMHWSGQGAYDDYDILATASTAGGQPSRIRRLQIGSRLIAGCDLGQQLNLVWSDAALYLNQFVNNSFVYQTRLAGTDCGLVGPAAFTTVGGVAFWSGNNAFFMFNGSVQKMPESDDIAEWLFKRVRPFYTVKTIAWHNARYGEIWFGFCLDNDEEPTLAAVFNIEGRFWFLTEINRTAGTTFQGFDTRPIMAGVDGLLYRHDTGVDAAGEDMPWALETSIMEIEMGASLFTVQGVMLDMERQVGDIDVTLTGYDRSNANAQPIDEETQTITADEGSEDFRTTARLVKMRLEGSGVGCDFRMGIPKVEIVKSARRG